MRDAELYSNANSLQLDGANGFLQKYGQLVDWGDTREITLLDVGCGDGAVMVEVLLKRLPNLHSALGVDISEDMLKVARTKYGSLAKVSFAVFNVAVKNHDAVCQLGTFSHITSFYCLHWIQDQRQAFQNLFQMMRPDGQLFAVIVRKDSMLPVYQNLATTQMWGSYMEDWQERVPPYSFDDDWRRVVGDHLKAAGFVGHRLECSSHTGYFKSELELKASLQAINIFIHRIPEELKDQYMEDVMRAYLRYTPCKTGYEHPYEVIVLHANR